MVTRILLIRHGEAEGNVVPYFQGSSDTELTPRGRAQLQSLAERFRGAAIDRIYCSPLKRARETAEELSAVCGAPLTEEGDLRELCGGDWEGIPVADLVAIDPERFHIWNASIYDFCAPNGEPMRNVYARMQAALTRIAQENPGKTVAVCSHGCAIRNFLCFVMFRDIRMLDRVGWADNTAVSLVEYDTEGDAENRWRLVTKNDASHLPPELRGRPNPAWKPETEETA